MVRHLTTSILLFSRIATGTASGTRIHSRKALSLLDTTQRRYSKAAGTLPIQIRHTALTSSPPNAPGTSHLPHPPKIGNLLALSPTRWTSLEMEVCTLSIALDTFQGISTFSYAHLRTEHGSTWGVIARTITASSPAKHILGLDYLIDRDSAHM